MPSCPYLEADDIREALADAAWRVDEQEVPLGEHLSRSAQPVDAATIRRIVREELRKTG